MELLKAFNIKSQNEGCSTGSVWIRSAGAKIDSFSPVDGKLLASVTGADKNSYENIIRAAEAAFIKWRMIPAPQRGEIVRQVGDALRHYKEPLGKLVSYEMGKSLSEGLGEVQEMIDICDFAVGLSRQLYGLSMHSERPSHRMYEQWQPLGVCGVITAFNFPVAVWAWNAALAVVCGDPVVWKPSHKVPLTAIAVQNICHDLMKRFDCPGLFGMVMGSVEEVGERMLNDRRIPLISATGSTRMGRRIAEVVGPRMGRTILELGGNNAIVVMDDADLDLAVRAVTFAACGTAGQRCTTARRLVVQK